MLTSLDPNSRLIEGDSIRDRSEPDARRLARLVSAYAPYDGVFDLRVPGVHVIRRSSPDTHLVYGVQQPALCIVAQGAKRALLNQEVFEYDTERMIAFSVDLPMAFQVTRASRAEPLLCVRLDLDPHKIAELVLRVYPHGLPQAQQKYAVYVGRSSTSIVNATIRLIELMGDAADAALIAPLAIDEILIRLLLSPIGGRVAQIGYAESSVSRVAKAIDWLRANYTQPMNVEELAELTHMSVSSFHQHFKAVTSMSPLQFQKALRLHEARQLMMSTMMDVGTASRQVGYLSASQFTREYSRFFGYAPSKDIARLREQSLAAVEMAQ
ncbi:MAG: AraC family transcriptional regulator [Anaerolineae bacterium]